MTPNHRKMRHSDVQTGGQMNDADHVARNFLCLTAPSRTVGRLSALSSGFRGGSAATLMTRTVRAGRNGQVSLGDCSHRQPHRPKLNGNFVNYSNGREAFQL